MATFPPLPQLPTHRTEWSPQALAMAKEAKALSASRLEQLVVRIQRHTGRTKEACWRFVIQQGLKGNHDHRRWTEAERDFVREELVKRPVAEVAKKLNRTPKAVRSMLMRQQLSIRDIRCDLFSLESLSAALRVRKTEILVWIERRWLPTEVTMRGGRQFHTVTPEGLQHLYKNHQRDLLSRGIRNLSLFEAYVQYCFAPKHTIGEQLLDVRRDKRERASFAAMNAVGREPDEEEEDGEDDQDEEEFGPSPADLEELEESGED
jgi:hypothetical protein